MRLNGNCILSIQLAVIYNNLHTLGSGITAALGGHVADNVLFTDAGLSQAAIYVLISNIAGLLCQVTIYCIQLGTDVNLGYGICRLTAAISRCADKADNLICLSIDVVRQHANTKIS